MPGFAPVGELSPDRDIPEWWTSAPIPVPYFDGLLLPVVFCVEPEAGHFEADVVEAVQTFFALSARDRLEAASAVFANYRDYARAVGESQLDVRIRNASQIWSHVYPSTVRVHRRGRRDMEVYVVIECECDWEIEHGLQLVYRQGSRLTRVSDQDGHLTHADAYDLPEPLVAS